MSLYKRKDSPYWWVKIQIPGRPAVSESTRTEDRVAAQEYHDRRAAELWRQAKLKERPRHIWEEAVVEFLAQTAHKRDHDGDKARLRYLDAFFAGLYLDDHDALKGAVNRVKREKRERAAGTVNRYLATIRSVLRLAQREGMVDSVPHLRLLPEPQKRIRWITQEEAQRLLAALPAHLKPAAAFALATGLRQSNVFGLEWAQIDMQRHVAWIYSDQAKGKRDIAVPLNPDALAILKGQIGQHDRYVFTYAGKPMQRPDKETWRRACQKAGISDFRWHDLRHTWASWHVMNGTSLQELMELGGWRDIKMVLRYAHLSGEHLKKAASNVTIAATLELRGGHQLTVIDGGKTAK